MSNNLGLASEVIRLRNTGWLTGLAPALQDAVLSASTTRQLRSGQAVYRQGDDPDGLYALLEGRVALRSYSETGQPHLLMLARAGDWFGEISTLDAMPRQQDAVSDGTSRVLHIPMLQIERLGAIDPEFWRGVGRLAGQHGRAALHFIDALVGRSSRARVAAALLLLHRAHSDREIEISHEQLAANTGLTRQTVNTILRQFQSQNIVELGYRKIRLTDLYGLICACDAK